MSGFAFIECSGSWVNANRIVSFRDGSVPDSPRVVVYDTWGQYHTFKGTITDFLEKLSAAYEALA